MPTQPTASLEEENQRLRLRVAALEQRVTDLSSIEFFVHGKKTTVGELVHFLETAEQECTIDAMDVIRDLERMSNDAANSARS